MVDVAELGIRIDSSPATKAAKELDALTVSATRAGDAAQDLAATSGRKLAPGMAAGGQQSRMMAMQLSQVAQQASATGNYVQALSIQLPDMAMGFGAAGIAAGILASVTLPLLASAFGSTGDEAKHVSEAVNAFAEATDAYVSAADAAALSTDELAAKYGRLATEAQAALAAMRDIALVDAMNAADEAIRQTLDSLTAMRDFAGSDLFSATESVLTLKDAFGMAYDDAARLRQALEDLSRADGLGEQARAAAQVQQALIGAYGSAERMPKPLRDAYAQMALIVTKGGEIETKADNIRVLLDQAARAADSAAAAVGGIGTAASNAYGAVSDLVAKMWEMGQARGKAMGAIYDDGMTTGNADWAKNSLGFTLPGSELLPTKPKGAGGGGGGGGGADPYGDRLKALIENLRTEREIEDEWYQESLAILTDRRAQEIMGKQAHDAAMIALHEEYQRRIAEIDANSQQQRISDTANLFGALASIAQAGGQKTAKIVAAFQAIEGTVNAYGAAIKALNTPGLSLAGRFAAYASVLAAGLKGVAAIRSAGGIGGGGGRMAAQGMTSQASGPAIEYRVYGLERDAVYSGAFLEKIFDGLMEEGKRRGAPTTSMVFV